MAWADGGNPRWIPNPGWRAPRTSRNCWTPWKRQLYRRKRGTWDSDNQPWPRGILQRPDTPGATEGSGAMLSYGIRLALVPVEDPLPDSDPPVVEGAAFVEAGYLDHAHRRILPPDFFCGSRQAVVRRRIVSGVLNWRTSQSRRAPTLPVPRVWSVASRGVRLSACDESCFRRV